MLDKFFTEILRKTMGLNWYWNLQRIKNSIWRK